MTVYADEEFYKKEYLCGKKAVIDTAFLFYARSATQKIKLYTCENVNEESIPESVKMCCCELAERLYTADREQSESGNITSESVGGWSKQYESTEKRQQRLDKATHDIVYKWLSGTGLLFRGLR